MHRILVIGAGSIGERHLRCFQSTGRTETHFVETRDDLRQSLAEKYQTTGYANLTAAMDQPFHAAVIATPAPLHIPQALQCVQAGWHVLIEKPLSVTPAGISELQAAVARQHVVAGVAYVYRCSPVLTRLRDAVQSGQFGRPVQWTATCGQHFPTFRPAYRTIYYADPQAGGGAIQDALTHILNAGEWILGPINRLVADAEHQVLPGVTVEDTVHLIARHGTTLASYTLNQHQAPNEIVLTVNCETGTARVELPRNRFSWMARPGDDWTVEDFAPAERDAMFITQANRFLDAIEGHAPVPCSLEDGLQTMKVNLAALASVKNQAWAPV